MTLSSQQLATLQRRAARYLKDTCTIEVQVDNSSDYGTIPVSWDVVATNVPCRIFNPNPDNAPMDSQETDTDRPRIAVPVGTGLGVDQRITVTSTGRVWQVIKLNLDRTDAVDEQAYIAREMRT